MDNIIVVSRFLTGVTQDGESVRIAPGRYPFVDEFGRLGRDLRTVIELPGRIEAAISESDYSSIRQEIS